MQRSRACAENGGVVPEYFTVDGLGGGGGQGYSFRRLTGARRQLRRMTGWRRPPGGSFRRGDALIAEPGRVGTGE